ncbi:MAG: hypothetical protein DI539_00915 [Flavobacterium psychrophilum]|nr:MAG: hypothetical protein DI539_00915 [Flavobacterium psychrophilum]
MSIIIYLAKASGLIAVFFTAYYLLFRKETFFIQIRFFLLTGIITAFILPLLRFTKTVWITPQPIAPVNLENFKITQGIVTQKPEFQFDWWQFATIIYTIGAVIFLVKFIIEIVKVNTLLKSQKYQRDHQYKIIDSEAIASPFSFFRYIAYNSRALETEELKTIIAHEKVHSRQLHSFDMILSQLSCIFLWFSPFTWLYKKQIAQNLEFIADADAVKAIDNSIEYQKTLLKITLQQECISITNHFYQSLIKKRIVMLNTKQSKKYNFLKFAAIVPAIIAFIYLYQIEVVAKERDAKIVESVNPIPVKMQSTDEIATGSEISYPLVTAVIIDKDMTNTTMKDRKEMYKDLFDADVYFENIKRNKKNEIVEIKVSVKDKNHIKAYPVYEILSDDDKPIYPFTLNIEKESADADNVIYFTSKNGGNETITFNKPEAGEPKKGLNDYVENAVKNEKKIVVINGVIQKEENIVFRGKKEVKIIELSGEEAVKKYGEIAKYGALEFTTSDFDPKSTDKTTIVTHTTTKTDATSDVNTSITDRVKQMNSSPYRTVTQTSLRDNDGNLISNDGKNIYFIINKTTTDIQLNSYKEDLEKAGITVVYSDVTRNSTGIITNIKISLKEGDVKSTAKLSSEGKKNGIPDIYIGRIKGQLTASSVQ